MISPEIFEFCILDLRKRQAVGTFRHACFRCLFQAGPVPALPAALDLLNRVGIEPVELIDRHGSGDFGESVLPQLWQRWHYWLYFCNLGTENHHDNGDVLSRVLGT